MNSFFLVTSRNGRLPRDGTLAYTHATRGHRCGRCYAYGHGVRECGDARARAALRVVLGRGGGRAVHGPRPLPGARSHTSRTRTTARAVPCAARRATAHLLLLPRCRPWYCRRTCPRAATSRATGRVRAHARAGGLRVSSPRSVRPRPRATTRSCAERRRTIVIRDCDIYSYIHTYTLCRRVQRTRLPRSFNIGARGVKRELHRARRTAHLYAAVSSSRTYARRIFRRASAARRPVGLRRERRIRPNACAGRSAAWWRSTSEGTCTVRDLNLSGRTSPVGRTQMTPVGPRPRTRRRRA